MSELHARMRDSEDRLVERKPSRPGKTDIKKTLVAFANSVPEGRTGVLFIGVSDSGEVLGVTNADDVQRDVRRIAQDECYPPIDVDFEVLGVEGRSVVAAIVAESSLRPHFAGAAFVRRGSESVSATEDVLHDLIASRNSIVRTLQYHLGKSCTVVTAGKQLGHYFPISPNDVNAREYKIVKVTPHFVTFTTPAGSGRVSEILPAIRLSWDDANDRLQVVVFHIPGANA